MLNSHISCFSRFAAVCPSNCQISVRIAMCTAARLEHPGPPIIQHCPKHSPPADEVSLPRVGLLLLHQTSQDRIGAEPVPADSDEPRLVTSRNHQRKPYSQIGKFIRVPYMLCWRALCKRFGKGCQAGNRLVLCRILHPKYAEFPFYALG